MTTTHAREPTLHHQHSPVTKSIKAPYRARTTTARSPHTPDRTRSILHMNDAWDSIERLVAWLDAESNATPEMARVLRILKITEEAGEVAEAVHGVSGSNPRKGTSHTWEDVQAELCDVLMTSMVALKTLTPDAEKIFAERLNHVAERSLNP